MSARSQLGKLRRGVLSSACRRLVSLGLEGPIVTFSFDDFPRTSLTLGARILETFGARATYYTSMSLINTTNRLGELFRREDLETLHDRGHEVASHTFSHLSARQVDYYTFKRDVEWGEAAIEDAMGVTPSGNFAYPYGDVTLRAKKNLGPELVSCRGTCSGLNGLEIDVNLLRANSLYGDVDRAGAAKQLILKNEERRCWLIFYSHDVAESPSPFGCTPELLESVCSFARARKGRVMTVAEVMLALGQQRVPPVAEMRYSNRSSRPCTV
jgi:peptidoglycan/xylan/chitin deacetylase (PgdA/CDA1 family)